MRPRLSVLHLASSYGGAERLTEALWPEIEKTFEARFLTNAPEIFSLPAKKINVSPFFPSWPQILGEVFTLRALLTGGETILSVMHYASFLAVLAARLKRPRAKVIAALHGPILPALNTVLRAHQRTLRAAAKLLVRLADTVIVPSHGLKQELVAAFGLSPTRCVVVPNGIPEPGPSPLPQPFPWPVGKRRLLWMGRLAPEKAPQDLILALQGLKDLPWHLVVLGDGPLRQPLEALASQKGLSSHITWLGFQKEVVPYLLAAEVFIHTCLFEGFGLAMLEAMACGCAVVAEDCPYGPRELLDYGRFGQLVSSVSEMEKALRRLVLDDAYLAQEREKARTRARAFPLKRTIEGYRQVCEAGI